LLAGGNIEFLAVFRSYEYLLLGCLLVVGIDGGFVDEVGTHIQYFGEDHLALVLLLSVYSFVLKSFQMEDQYFGSLVDLQNLLGQLVLFAVGAVPLVTLLEFLLL